MARLPHFVQGLVLGAIIVGASLALYDPAVEYFGYGQVIRAGTDWTATSALKLGFGQVYTAFVGLILAGTLGLFAIKQFAEAHAVPDLRLALRSDSWPDGTEAQVIVIRPHHGLDTVHFDLHNDSSIIGLWYAVQLRLPYSVVPPITLEDGLLWDPEKLPDEQIGIYFPMLVQAGRRADNWREEAINRHEEWVVTFRSNGAIAAYPGFPLPLCDLWLEERLVQGLKGFIMKYTIWLEHGTSRHGTLRVWLVGPKETAGRTPSQSPSVGAPTEGPATPTVT